MCLAGTTSSRTSCDCMPRPALTRYVEVIEIGSWLVLQMMSNFS